MEKITVATLIEALRLIVGQSPEVAEYEVEIFDTSGGCLTDLLVLPESKKLAFFSKVQK